ncbi:MAG TPA: efflux RND transporter periplasmic adaptor subunit [Myxococcales bacterium]|nr:efflux RND transporter periplasmic adaptor subunit [Myxococcales bacterium]
MNRDRSRGVAFALGALFCFCGMGPAVAAPRLVATVRIQTGPEDVTIPEKVAVLLAGERRDLAFEVPGRLEFCLDEGTTVELGRVVARLDETLEKAQFLGASLRLRDSRSEERRIRGLRDAQAASAQQLEGAETRLALRRAEAAVAREQLERRTLTSPLGGEIVATYLEAGEVATPGTRVATVMDFSWLRLKLGIPGFQIGLVEEGDRVRLAIPSMGERVVEGEVRRVAGAAADGRHLFDVEVFVPNEDGKLRPGMMVGASIVTDHLPFAMGIPLEAVVERKGRKVAFFVHDGVARALSLESAIRVGNRLLSSTEIPSSFLVVRGQRDLFDGAPVRVDNTVLSNVAQQ